MNHTRAVDLLDSLLKELDSWWDSSNLFYSKDGSRERIDIFKVELRFLRTFLVYVENWDGAAKGAGHLGTLVVDIEAGFKESNRAFRAASKKGIERSREHLDAAISKLQEKIMAWRPQIKAAYDYVESSYSFKSHPPLSNYDLWMPFCGSLEQNLLDLLGWNNKLPTVVVHQLHTVNEMLGNLRYFLRGLIQDLGLKKSKVRYLLTHFGAVLVRAAHISYLCLVDMDSLDEFMTKMLSDLLKKFKPNTPRVIEGCLNILMAPNKTTGLESFGRFLLPEKYQVDILNQGLRQIEKPFDQLKNFTTNTVREGYLDRLRPSDKALDFTTQLELFCRFLFYSDKCQVETLNKGLGQLVLFVFYSHILYKADAVRLVLINIVAAFSELGSYLCNGHETTRDRSKEIDPALNKLLQKIMILVLEAFLINLNLAHLKVMPTEKSRFNSIQRGLAFVQNFFGDNLMVLEPIWIYIENVVSNVRSISDNAHHYRTLDEKSLHIISEQLFMIRILKMEIHLEELLHRYLSLLPNVENQIKALHEELVLVRTFLMVEQGENEQLNLTRVKAVLRDVISIFYSLDWNEITEDLQKFNLLLPELLEKVDFVSADMKEMYMRVQSSLPSYFPRTEEFAFVDFLLRDLEELLNSKDVSVNKVKHQIRVVHRDMELLRSYLKNMRDEHNENSDLKSLVSHIVDVAFQVQYITDSFVCGDGVLWYHVVWLSDLIEDIRLTKIQASEISKIHGISVPYVLQSTRKVISPAKISLIDEVVVDLVDENESMIDRLTRGSLQLDVISIVGMAGIGKTTLARKVYNNPSVTYHFHIRAWCYVSQVYQKRKLLLEILGETVELTDDILDMSDEDLYVQLYRSLRGKRYLIVMDDMWNIEAWNDLERSFANDENGSRILITSRLHDVAKKTKADSIPHPLRLLSIDESWKLLQRKLFKAKGCPDELVDLGKQIASSCKGLPLALVAISGLLQRTDMKQDWWTQVAESLSSLIANDPESRCMDILELSYKHLPNHLKCCFLYLGAFMEDKEIPVRKLIWLWVAEGFIQNAGIESLEDVAEEYLTDLIGRSLVMASKRRSNGGVKTCRVHDMLRTLCSLICKEESFLEQVTGRDEVFASFSDDLLDFGVPPNYRHPTNPVTYQKRRLSIYSKRNHFIMSKPSGPLVHSLLYFATSDLRPKCPYNISFIAENFKRLRVLDLECINMGQSFPNGIEVLVRLRYLALSGDVDCIPNSIANLRNLQILVLMGLKGIVLLPDTIWSLEKLQHLHVNNGAAFSLQAAEMEISPQLDNLVSLSSPVLSGGRETENILRRLPQLRKLKCIFSEDDNAEKWNQLPVLHFLKNLESLKVHYSGRHFHPHKFDFPLTLKKLTLSKFHLPWDRISEIGKLPNIEVLKLLSGAFDGKIWDMNDGEFLKLKFLKLDTLSIARWNASGDNLPNLQHLVLRSCRQLEEVPSGFGDIPTLEVIEVQMCRGSVEESVKQIRQEQLEMGNEELKILINRSDLDV